MNICVNCKGKCDGFRCHVCDSIYCGDKECEFLLTSCWSNDFGERILVCLNCIKNEQLHIDKYRNIKCHYIDIVFYYASVEHYESRIEELRKENERLKTMIDYQPGGKGYVEPIKKIVKLSKK